MNSSSRKKVEARLPAELVDQAIDHLHDNIASLAQCSLVCKVWLPAASYHLLRSLRFRTSTLVLHPTSKRWQITDAHEPDVARRAFLELINALEQSPRLRSYVEKMNLEIESHRQWNSKSGLELSFLGRLLANLPNLRGLRISTPQIYNAVEDSWSPVPLHAALRRLQYLCFFRTKLTPQIFHVLRHYTQIHMLVFRHVHDLDSNIAAAVLAMNTGNWKLSVNTLVYGSPGGTFAAAETLNILSQWLDDTSLISLDITALAPFAFPTLTRFLQGHGRNLRSLAFGYDIAGLGRENPAFIPLDLSCCCPRISTLHIVIHVDCNRTSEYNGTLQFEGVLEMLEHAAPSQLRSLVLWCEVHDLDVMLPSYRCRTEAEEEAYTFQVLKDMAWGRLDKVGLRLMTRSLRTIDLKWNPWRPFVRRQPFEKSLRQLSVFLAAELSYPVKSMLTMSVGRYSSPKTPNKLPTRGTQAY